LQNKVFMSRNGAVATEHPLASLAALEALKSGGNAVDAAVAASFTLAVTQPHLGGLGGDFFALYYDSAHSNVSCLNSSGWAPSGLTGDAMKSNGYGSMPEYGPFSVVVPGHVKGIYELHRKFGKLDFSKMLEYSVKLAEEGFPAYPGLARGVQVNLDSFPVRAKNTFAPKGKALQPGEILAQKAMGRVLRAIADEGPAAFYEGWIAEKTVATLTRSNLPIDLEDFHRFEPEWCQPIRINYYDATIYEVPPNSMGATTLLILRSLESMQLANVKPNSRERIESTLRVVKQAYAKRDRVLGDPRFVKFDLDEFLKQEGSSAERSDIRSFGGDTTYFAVIDAEGNMVSGIQSLFHHFGSRVFVDDCGFFLNNRGSGFKLEGPNKVEPRKRPLHTLSALMVGWDGEIKMALGASGGEYRPQQHALFVTNLVDYSMSLEEALAFPRFLWDGRKVLVENGYTNPKSLNYEVEMLEYPGRTGVAQGVESMNGVKKAVCDLRGEGLPMGWN
jgi:gamma-glutamyltranspeptidase/glutathione hydrolase